MTYSKTIILYASIVCSVTLEGAWSWKKAVPFFTKQEETITESYTIDNSKQLMIEALTGSITIHPSSRNMLTVSAVKRGIPEELPLTSVETVKTDENVVIKTKEEPTKGSVAVDFTIAVPKKITRITVVSKAGSVTIEDIAKPLEVYTTVGNITIKESTKSVQARSERGSIYVNQKTLSSGSSFIFIETMRGNVQLILPAQVCANLHARTLKGTLTSTIPVTLQPRTTVLTAQSWERMKREARGTLGYSDDFGSAPPLTIDVTKGNIVISARK